MGNFKPRHAFALSPPGRWRFLTHLLDQARYFGVRMTWRHKIVFYANAVGALFVGYRNFARGRMAPPPSAPRFYRQSAAQLRCSCARTTCFNLGYENDPTCPVNHFSP